MAGGIRVKYSQNCLPCHDLNLSHLLLYGEITSFIVAIFYQHLLQLNAHKYYCPFNWYDLRETGTVIWGHLCKCCPAVGSCGPEWAEWDVALLPVGQAGLWRAQVPVGGRDLWQLGALSGWGSNSLTGSCHPDPFFSPSAVKALFLPAALCPREGDGGGGSLRGAVGVFCFSSWRRALSEDPFEDAMSFQCMGVAETAEHLQGTESSERGDLVGHVEG